MKGRNGYHIRRKFQYTEAIPTGFTRLWPRREWPVGEAHAEYWRRLPEQTRELREVVAEQHWNLLS